MNTLYLMSGLSGAGKTTFAKYMAKEKGLTYLGIDDFYKAFNGDETCHDNEFQVWMSFYQAIHAAGEMDKSVVVDTNAPTLAQRTEFLNWFGSYDDHVLIYISAKPSLCKKNNTARLRTVPADEFHRMLLQLQPVTIAEDRRWDDVQCYRNINNDYYQRYSIPSEGCDFEPKLLIQPLNIRKIPITG